MKLAGQIAVATSGLHLIVAGVYLASRVSGTAHLHNDHSFPAFVDSV